MFMDADVLYHPILLEKLILSPHRNCFIVDRQFQSDDDSVKLCLRANKVVDFGKTVDVLYDTVGEWPGFLKMSPAIAVKVADSVQGFIDRGEEVGPYEDAFREVLLSEPADTFAHEDVTDIPWIEIDYPSDLKKATTNIFPRISDYLAEITVTEAEAKPADEDGSTASGA
jgi:choline kinase